MENSIKNNEFSQAYRPVLFFPKNDKDRNDLKKLKETGKVMFFDTFDLQLTELIKSQNPKRKLSHEETVEKKIEFYSNSDVPESENGCAKRL